MRVIFFGTPQFAVPSLEWLLAHPEFDVLAAVTQPDKRRGRGSSLIASEVKQVALAQQIPVWQPQRLKKDTATLTQLAAASADVFVVVAYGQILSPQILAMPRLGCINVHGSLLPKYRGAAPIQWSLYHGEGETGVTTMLMDAGMDTGEILLKASTPIGLLDNAWEIAHTLANQGAELLRETLLQLERGILTPIPQNSAEATYAPLIAKEDCAIDWTRPALDIHNQVRGFFPNCTSIFRDKPLKVMKTVPLGEEYWAQLPSSFEPMARQWTNFASLSGIAGEVVGTIKNFGAIVQTGRGLLLLQELQIAGKRPQSGWDFVNGSHLQVGEMLIDFSRGD
jgi:methionyl-tRNA formyltransferase